MTKKLPHLLHWVKYLLFSPIYLLVFISSINYSNAQPCFDTSAQVRTNTSSEFLSVSDFNRDGKMDMVADYDGDTVLVSLGDGLGGFYKSSVFNIGRVTSSEILCKDFNNDGKIDIVAGINNFISYGISIILGDGSGGFSSPTFFKDQSQLVSLTSADYNGDGKLDIATANNSNISIFFGNGLGSFLVVKTFNVGKIPLSITSSDFNGDGKMDLATVNNTSNDMSLLLGNGSGGFTLAQSIVLYGRPISIISADFNSDGKIDIATIEYYNISIMIGNGSGGFSTPVNYSNFRNDPIQDKAICVDFNGDGKMDLIVGERKGITLLIGEGTGSFSKSEYYPVNIYDVNRSINSLTTADLI